VNIKQLAEIYHVSRKYIRREFFRWCQERGLDPYNYHVPGTGYHLPKDFIEHFRRLMDNET